MNRPALFTMLLSGCLLCPPDATAQRVMEKLDRGVVAVNQGEGKVFVGWRLLGTDPDTTLFNVYKTTGTEKPVKLNWKPIDGPTHFIDEKADLTKANAYSVRALINRREEPPGKPFVLPAGAPVRQYISIPLKTPEGYSPNDVSAADLDGDGEYELVVHQVGRGRDNSQMGVTTEPILEAYKLDGTQMWRINLGKNIREGAHYTQFMVYDLDGDGKAELACKTADGTVDGKGKVIGDANAKWVNEQGLILEGPEFLTVFDGATGAELATTDYIPSRGNDQGASWGDKRGNRVDRFLAGVAYLDGKLPSLIMARGYYTRAVLAAWDWRGGKLTKRWVFDSDDDNPENRKYRGQGNHNLSIGDVDGDGKDEIIYGAAAVDDNGKGLYSTGLGHGDALHLSDLDPDRPGMEVFNIQERFSDAGANFRDAKTGEVIWKKPSVKAGGDGEGPGRGLCIDIDPRHRGVECWVRGAEIHGVFNAKGDKISDAAPKSCNFGIFWDGDTLSELLDSNRISKWSWTDSQDNVIFTAEGCASNNGTKSTPALSADILGDWREEVIFRTTDNKELRVFTTTIPTQHRFYTLMHDPQYRLSIAWQNVAYNQPPHTSFFMGDGMAKPPRPQIVTPAAKPARTRR